MKLTETYERWAVIVTGDVRLFFSVDGAGGNKLFFKHKEAVAYKNELAKHVQTKCKVVRVTVTITEQ